MTSKFIVSPRSYLILAVTAEAIIIMCLCWFMWHSRGNALGKPTSFSQPDGTFSAATSDAIPTVVYAHNLMLRKGPDFRIYIRWIHGQMLRTRRLLVPSFDDPGSFVLQIEKGVIRANIGDISNYLNTSSPSNTSLKDLSLQPDGELLKLRGTVHKVIDLPVEIVGKLSPSLDGRVLFEVVKINVLKMPLRRILGSLNVELSDLVHASDVPGIQVAGNDIFFDTQKLLPPPHIHGRLSAVLVRPPDLELVYGDAIGSSPSEEIPLARWHNFLLLSGGTLNFGLLTMHPVDITMIDASPAPWFDLDLVNYQAQLVNGYTRMTPQAGLEIFMPAPDWRLPKKTSQSITLEWLRNRDRSLPRDVPLK